VDFVTIAELVDREFILQSNSDVVSPPELVLSTNTDGSFNTINLRYDKPSAVRKFIAAGEKAANRALDEVERCLKEAELCFQILST
jgi:hypothetical protein